MKQINLETKVARRPSRDVCAGKLFVVWALYGAVTALGWEFAEASHLTEAAIWAIALVAGLGLALGMQEV